MIIYIQLDKNNETKLFERNGTIQNIHKVIGEYPNSILYTEFNIKI